MEPEHTQTLLEALMSSDSENIRQKAIHAAYYVYETFLRERSNVETVRAKAEEILIRGSFDDDEEVRTRTRHCIYYLVTKSADAGIKILDGIQKRQTIRSLRSLQRAFETIGVVSILIYSDHYGESQLMNQLGEVVRRCFATIGLAGRGMLRKAWHRVLMEGAGFIVTMNDYGEYTPINSEEADYLLKSKDLRRTVKPTWMHLLEYAKLEKPFGEGTSSELSWETIKEEIITLGNQDIISFGLLSLIFSAQVAFYRNEDIVLSLIEQIAKRGKKIGCGFGYGLGGWLLSGVYYALITRTVDDDIRMRFKAFVEETIKRTYERGYLSKLGLRYKPFCLAEYTYHELLRNDTPTPQFLNKWLMRATETRDTKMFVYIIENLKALAVYYNRNCGHTLAVFKQIFDEVIPQLPSEDERKEVSESLFNALAVIYPYYPYAIEEFINSLQNKITPEAMTEIRGSKILVQSTRLLLWMRLYNLLNKIMIDGSSEIRNQVINGIASAVLCGSSNEFAVQVIKYFVNGVSGTNFKVKRLNAPEHGFGQKIKKVFLH